jgi:hypothetical protein
MIISVVSPVALGDFKLNHRSKVHGSRDPGNAIPHSDNVPISIPCLYAGGAAEPQAIHLLERFEGPDVARK